MLMSPNLQLSFWVRMGLQETDREICIRVVQEIYPEQMVHEFQDQGYCSFTLLVSRTDGDSEAREGGHDCDWENSTLRTQTLASSIIQIRPAQHALNLGTAHAARQTYGAFAPRARNLNVKLPGSLQALEMDKMHGTPFSRLQPRCRTLEPEVWYRQINLIQSFATFIARGWRSSFLETSLARHVRADSPMLDTACPLEQCRGKVGVNIASKLNRLAEELADIELRQKALETLEKVQGLKDYPVVLNHGDLIPSNVLISEAKWDITGIVDWAEAEWLPFGICLYGLEHLLGYVERSSSLPSSAVPTSSVETGSSLRARFQYYDNAPQLRELFWRALLREAPEVKERICEVMAVRDLGIMLWYGYAWDEGKIDRVVNEVDDAEEIDCLRTFIGIPTPMN